MRWRPPFRCTTKALQVSFINSDVINSRSSIWLLETLQQDCNKGAADVQRQAPSPLQQSWWSNSDNHGGSADWTMQDSCLNVVGEDLHMVWCSSRDQVRLFHSQEKQQQKITQDGSVTGLHQLLGLIQWDDALKQIKRNGFPSFFVCISRHWSVILAAQPNKQSRSFYYGSPRDDHTFYQGKVMESWDLQSEANVIYYLWKLFPQSDHRPQSVDPTWFSMPFKLKLWHYV